MYTRVVNFQEVSGSFQESFRKLGKFPQQCFRKVSKNKKNHSKVRDFLDFNKFCRNFSKNFVSKLSKNTKYNGNDVNVGLVEVVLQFPARLKAGGCVSRPCGWIARGPKETINFSIDDSSRKII